MFLKLKYPEKIIDSTFDKFKRSTERQQLCETPNENPVRVMLPIKDQKSADRVRRQLTDLSRKINHEVQPIFTSAKLAQELKVVEVSHRQGPRRDFYETYKELLRKSVFSPSPF